MAACDCSVLCGITHCCVTEVRRATPEGSSAHAGTEWTDCPNLICAEERKAALESALAK